MPTSSRTRDGRAGRTADSTASAETAFGQSWNTASIGFASQLFFFAKYMPTECRRHWLWHAPAERFRAPPPIHGVGESPFSSIPWLCARVGRHGAVQRLPEFSLLHQGKHHACDLLERVVHVSDPPRTREERGLEQAEDRYTELKRERHFGHRTVPAADRHDAE